VTGPKKERRQAFAALESHHCFVNVWSITQQPFAIAPELWLRFIYPWKFILRKKKRRSFELRSIE